MCRLFMDRSFATTELAAQIGIVHLDLPAAHLDFLSFYSGSRMLHASLPVNLETAVDRYV